VLDDDDISLVDQRCRGVAGTAVGEERELAILLLGRTFQVPITGKSGSYVLYEVPGWAT
jgi:hypothetical protein